MSNVYKNAMRDGTVRRDEMPHGVNRSFDVDVVYVLSHNADDGALRVRVEVNNVHTHFRLSAMMPFRFRVDHVEAGGQFVNERRSTSMSRGGEALAASAVFTLLFR
jgi:hypothetical protein